MRIALVLVLALLKPALAQQSIVEGNSTVNGSTIINSLTSQYVSIFVVNPPNPTANTTFVPQVMTQNAIDGVTVPLSWANIETTAPNTTPCTPAPSDTCQPDPIVPMYHHYVWLPLNGGTYDSLNYPGIWTWFEPVGPSPGVAKTVNLLLDGENAGTTNVSTPRYVTDSTWYGLFTTPYAPTTTYARQDVINAINCSGLTSWGGTNPNAISYNTGTQAVTITSSATCCSTSPTDSNLIQSGDLVWTTIPANSTCATGNNGAMVVAVNSSTSFSYTNNTCTTSGTISPSNAYFMSAFESWIVPYEWPYKSALKALWAATFAHFNSNYYANFGSSNVVVSSQLGYIRPGESVGGEAYPYCTSNLQILAPPYAYVTSGGTMNSSVGWLDYYTEMLQWGQSQAPFMTFFAPLNSISTYDFGMHEANIAATTSNGHGVIDGFGSQGLSVEDTTSFNGCGGSTSDWCDSFITWYGTGMPRELQQLSLSDEQNSSSCPGCGIPPNGNSGDLRVWLPFAVENYMTVLELYNLDAGLAFDPNYCTQIVLGSCTSGYSTSGTFLSTNQTLQAQFMNDVGQGSNCPGGGSGAGGDSSGTCSYALCLNDAHGLHPRPQLATSCMPY